MRDGGICLWPATRHPLFRSAAALPAFLLEATLFLTLGVESLRNERLPPAGVATLLVLGAIAPYCAASLALGSFGWQALAGIALLSGLVSFWYVVLPQKPAMDCCCSCCWREWF